MHTDNSNDNNIIMIASATYRLACARHHDKHFIFNHKTINSLKSVITYMAHLWLPTHLQCKL